MDLSKHLFCEHNFETIGPVNIRSEYFLTLKGQECSSFIYLLFNGKESLFVELGEGIQCFFTLKINHFTEYFFNLPCSLKLFYLLSYLIPVSVKEIFVIIRSIVHGINICYAIKLPFSRKAFCIWSVNPS